MVECTQEHTDHSRGKENGEHGSVFPGHGWVASQVCLVQRDEEPAEEQGPKEMTVDVHWGRGVSEWAEILVTRRQIQHLSRCEDLN